MIAEILKSDVVDLLSKELDYSCTIWAYREQVILEISNADFEKKMGNLVGQIQSIIDKHLPERNDDLSVVIRNTDKHTDNVIKIWMPVCV